MPVLGTTVLGKSRGILSYFTRHRTAANLLLVVMLVLGLVALPKMRTQFFPDIVINNITVNVNWAGVGAEDVDAAILQVLNPVLLLVESVSDIHTHAREGAALLVLEFEPRWNMGRAADEVQAAVDAVTTLPQDAEAPVIKRGAWRDRVTDVIITGPVGVDQLGRFADEFIARLFADGITRATIRGIAPAEILVEVTPKSLMKHGISMLEISRAIGQEAIADPAGDVAGANLRVRTEVAKRSAADIAAIVLRSNADGSALTIADVADVQTGGAARERAYFVGENPAVSVRVDRSARGDAIEIQRQVQAIATEMMRSLPPDVRIDLIRTRAQAISDRLSILLDNGLLGLGLVVLLLFLFLNARTAFWVAAGIPVAMLAAIAMMYLAGQTINMVSLFALIITLGIVVDDAIVVGEHADYRVRNLGESPVVAAENAAIRMAPPVFAATLTTVIAFGSLALLGGRLGDLISAIPLAVTVVLIASLIECFLILPHHMSRSLAHSAKEHWYDLPSRIVNRGFAKFRDFVFRPLMRLVIWARYPVLAGLIVILTVQAAHLIRGDVPTRFFVAPERSSISGNFAMLDGASRSDTLEMMREMQRATKTMGEKYEAKYGTNPILYIVAEVGDNSGAGLSGVRTKSADLLGSVAIELIEVDQRPYSSAQFINDLQDSVRQHPLTEIVSFRGWRAGPSGDSLAVNFYGADARTLKNAAEALKTAVSQFGEVSGVEDSLSYDKPELILDLTAQGRALGFSIDGLGQVLRHRLSGIEAATFPDGQRSASIRVALSQDALAADFLQRMQLRTNAGDYVPLTDIVTVQVRRGFSTVFRENGIRQVSVTGNISEDDPARAEEISKQIEQVILPGIASRFDVGFEMSGLAKQEREFMSDAVVGFALCLIGIFLVLAWIFSSWTRPFVVMAIIPFGIVGTVYGHLAWDVPLSMFTMQAQFLKPTVVTLVYGLAFGMVLVLFLVPTLLAIQQDFKRRRSAFKRALRKPRRTGLTGFVTAVAALTIAVLFSVTLGAAVVRGALPEILLQVLPSTAANAPFGLLAFALFMAGSILVVLLAYLSAGLVLLRRK